MRRLKVTHLSALETAEYDEGRSLAYGQVLKRLARFAEKNYITPATYAKLRARYEERERESREECAQIAKDPQLAEAALRIWTLGLEKEALQDLYVYGEISEHMYKRVLSKLAVRTEAVEHGKTSHEIHVSIKGDIFEQIAEWMRRFRTVTTVERAQDEYMYYRALTILANKAEKELARIRVEQCDGLFSPEVVARVAEVYSAFKGHAARKMHNIAAEEPEVIAKLGERLAQSGVLKVEERVLNRLIEGEMITPKVHAVLRDQMEREAE